MSKAAELAVTRLVEMAWLLRNVPEDDVAADRRLAGRRSPQELSRAGMGSMERIGTDQRVRHMVRATCFLLFCLAMVGCAPVAWEVDYHQPFSIDWPSAPRPLKVRYLGEIREFKQTGVSIGNVLAGRGEAGKIMKPVAVAVGMDGRLAIADLKSRGVHLYVPDEKRYQFIFQAAADILRSPVSVCFDQNLQLYIADSALNKVLIYDAAGRFVRAIATADNKPFGRPTSVVVQRGGGRVYVADPPAQKVHVFNVRGEFQYSIGGRGIEAGKFNLPTHLALSPAGILFINDAMNFRIQEYDPAQGFVASFGRHGNGSGDFAMSKGIGIDRWNVVYVVDTLFDCVQLFDRQGTFLLTIGSRGYAPGEFWMPSGLFIDHQDRLYICDTYNQRVQVFQLFDNELPGGHDPRSKTAGLLPAEHE